MDAKNNGKKITLCNTKTQYHDINVIKENGITYLLSGNGSAREQSAINLTCPREHIFDSSLFAMHSLLFIPNPSNILVVGLGGGIIPREFSYYCPNANIDVIEIDPKIVNIAESYFFFKKSDKVNIHVGDAFSVIKQLDKQYDIIVLDAFLTDYIPYHLMCKEFFDSIKQKIQYNSVVCSNTDNKHVSFNNYINTGASVLGNNIYRTNGFKNNNTTMLFFVNGNIKELNMYNVSFPFIKFIPEKVKTSDNIKNADIFSLYRKT